jgi:hypothetical protein
MKSRMRRSRPFAVLSHRRAKSFVRGKCKCDTASNDQRRRNFIVRHGIPTNSQVRELASQCTIKRAFRARQCIINNWLRRNLNQESLHGYHSPTTTHRFAVRSVDCRCPRRDGSKAGITARPNDLGICSDNRLTTSISWPIAIAVMRLKPAGHVAGQPGFEALGERLQRQRPLAR